MDLGMKSFQTAVEKFGRAGEFRHVDHRKSRFTQCRRGAAGGEQFHAHVVEFLGEGGQAGFIGNGQKSAGDWHKWSLSRSWMGADRVPDSANPVTNPPPPGKRNRRRPGHAEKT